MSFNYKIDNSTLGQTPMCLIDIVSKVRRKFVCSYIHRRSPYHCFGDTTMKQCVLFHLVSNVSELRRCASNARRGKKKVVKLSAPSYDDVATARRPVAHGRREGAGTSSSDRSALDECRHRSRRRRHRRRFRLNRRHASSSIDTPRPRTAPSRRAYRRRRLGKHAMRGVAVMLMRAGVCSWTFTVRRGVERLVIGNVLLGRFIDRRSYERQ